jgi:tetratricopeptide (TPR) repeat protein
MALFWFGFNSVARSQEQIATPDAQPPTLNEITAILDQEKPDPEAYAKRVAEAEATAPAGADDLTLAKFYYERAQARSLLGRSYDAIADCELALRFGKTSKYEQELSRYEQFMWRELLRVGDLKRAKDVINAQIANFQKMRIHGRLAGLYNEIAFEYIDAGLLDDAGSYLRRMKALFEEDKSFGLNVDVYGSDRLGGIMHVQAGLFEAQRRYVEAEAAYRRAQAYWRDAFVKSVQWPSRAPVVSWERSWDGLTASEGRMKVSQGRVAEGEVDVRRALLSRLTKEGKYQADTARIIRRLAEVMNEQGRNADAEKLINAAIDIYKTIGYSY